MTAGRQLADERLRASNLAADRGRVAARDAAGMHVRQVQPLVTHGLKEDKNLSKMMLEQFPHLRDIATDWKTFRELQRVCAYTFRGDTRTPGAIASAGGFAPPFERTDDDYTQRVVKPAFTDYMQRRFGMVVSDATFTSAVQMAAPANSAERRVLDNFFVWRAMTENEAYHVGRMLADETLKGYISTSRAVAVVRGFAKANGWVYLTRVRGGYLIPDQGAMEWTRIFGEQEIALPGKLEWRDVFGFRQVSNGSECHLVGPIYLRKGFAALNPTAFGEAYALLSGRPQR